MTHLLGSFADTKFMALAVSFLEDLLSLLFFMGSRPLQLGYLLFFSSYLIRILFFLSPLLLTTCLSLLLFLTIDDPNVVLPDFLGRTCGAVLDHLKHKVEGNCVFGADVGFVDSIFSEMETCLDYAVDACEEETMQIEENGMKSPKEEQKEGVEDGKKSHEEDQKEGGEDGKKSHKEKQQEGEEEREVFKQAFPSDGVIGWEEFEAIGKLYKALTHEVGEYPIKMAIRNLKKKQFLASEISFDSSKEVVPLEGWETPASEFDVSEAEFNMEMACGDQKLIGSGELKSLESYGSERREKEWKRSLACKLYEERWSAGSAVGNEEGMDLLWEEASKVDDNDDNKKVMKQMSVSRKDSKGRMKKNDGKRNKGEEEEEEDQMVGKFCCLHALKFSAGRMRFGMGKMSKLAKVTQALKGGVGLLQSSGKKSKKV